MSAIVLSQVSDKTRALLAEGPFKSWIGGKPVESASGQKISDICPASGEQFAEFYAMQRSDVDRAITAADQAFRSSGWATMPQSERKAYIGRFADLIERDGDILAELDVLDSGMAQLMAIGIAGMAAGTLRFYADADASLERTIEASIPGCKSREVLKPYGVVAVILPYNGPLLAVADNMGAALAAGNTLVVKPASNTPLSALYLGRLAGEAGIPAGVFNVVAGTAEAVGQSLVNDPRIKRLHLTGSVGAGKSVGAACGGNLVPVKLELGGKGAALVFDDVNIEEVADQLVGAITMGTGQICCTATRWIIHENIHDKMVAILIDKMKAVPVGDPFDPAIAMGAVISEEHLHRILSYVERGKAQGARVLTGGARAKVPGLPGGAFMQPTLMTGPLDNIAYREEIFGPVAYLTSFRDEAQGIALVNSTDYSLANSVWTNDLARANRVAEQMVGGTSWINTHNFLLPGLRFGGFGQSGYGGGINAVSTVRDYLHPLVVTTPA